MFVEGQRVAYVGWEESRIGDEAIVAEPGVTGSTVLWASGAHEGQYDLVSHAELVGVAGPAHDEFFAEGSLLGFDVNGTYRREGRMGVLSSLEADGHLMGFAQLADEVVAHTAARLREDPSLAEAARVLGPEAGHDFLLYAARKLLSRALRAA